MKGARRTFAVSTPSRSPEGKPLKHDVLKGANFLPLNHIVAKRLNVLFEPFAWDGEIKTTSFLPILVLTGCLLPLP